MLLWAVVTYPAGQFWGSEVLVQSGAAMLLCLVPAVLSLALSQHALRQSPEWQLLAFLGGTGLRMVVVLGVGFLLFHVVPALRGDGFWVWLIVFYLATLAGELWLLVAGKSLAQRS